MPSGNPMPNMLRLPSVNKPPRQEVAFDSKSSALCTKPQCLANELQNNKLSNTLVLTKYTYAYAVPDHDRWVAMGDYLSKLRRHLGFINFLGWKAIKYIWYLTFKYSCSPLYFSKMKGGFSAGDNGATWAGHKPFWTIRMATWQWCLSSTKCTALSHSSDLKSACWENKTPYSFVIETCQGFFNSSWMRVLN